MMHLSPAINQRNPWFQEYWEDIFSCKMNNDFPLEFNEGENIKLCENNFRLSELVG